MAKIIVHDNVQKSLHLARLPSATGEALDTPLLYKLNSLESPSRARPSSSEDLPNYTDRRGTVNNQDGDEVFRMSDLKLPPVQLRQKFSRGTDSMLFGLTTASIPNNGLFVATQVLEHLPRDWSSLSNAGRLRPCEIQIMTNSEELFAFHNSNEPNINGGIFAVLQNLASIKPARRLCNIPVAIHWPHESDVRTGRRFLEVEISGLVGFHVTIRIFSNIRNKGLSHHEIGQSRTAITCIKTALCNLKLIQGKPQRPRFSDDLPTEIVEMIFEPFIPEQLNVGRGAKSSNNHSAQHAGNLSTYTGQPENHKHFDNAVFQLNRRLRAITFDMMRRESRLRLHCNLVNRALKSNLSVLSHGFDGKLISNAKQFTYCISLSGDRFFDSSQPSLTARVELQASSRFKLNTVWDLLNVRRADHEDLRYMVSSISFSGRTRSNLTAKFTVRFVLSGVKTDVEVTIGLPVMLRNLATVFMLIERQRIAELHRQAVRQFMGDLASRFAKAHSMEYLGNRQEQRT